MKLVRREFKLQIILEGLIEINYLVIILGVPLAFAWFLKNFNVFELNKIVLFEILTWLLGFLTLAKIFLAKKRIWAPRLTADGTKLIKIEKIIKYFGSNISSVMPAIKIIRKSA